MKSRFNHSVWKQNGMVSRPESDPCYDWPKCSWSSLGDRRRSSCSIPRSGH